MILFDKANFVWIFGFFYDFENYLFNYWEIHYTDHLNGISIKFSTEKL